ncbi:sphingomyelin synthase-related protein 1, partial [Clarias magur]
MVTCDGVESWSIKKVALWLREQGFSEYVELLCVKHRVDGAALLCLTEHDLRSPPLQLPRLGDIKRLALALRRLQRRHTRPHASPGDSGTSSLFLLHTSGSKCCSWDDSTDQNGSPSNGIGMAVWAEHRRGYSNGKCEKDDGRLDPEGWKTAVSSVYVMLVFGITSFVMVLVHERVPDMRTYPPLPDIFLDSVPRIPWAFAMAEACALILCHILLLILLLHKHRSILFRRFCSLTGTVFLLRCVTMFVTSLSVPGHHLQCSGKMYGDIWSKLLRSLEIWSGFGMSLTGVHTCGDYMFSGHTVILTMLNFFVTE